MAKNALRWDEKHYATARREILNTFDFGAVHKTMKALDWGYNGEEGPPTYGAMYQMAEYLLQSVCKAGANTVMASSGGFTAERIDGTDITLSLRFAAAEADH